MYHRCVVWGHEKILPKSERVLRYLSLKDSVAVGSNRLPRIPMTLGRIMIPLSTEITLVGERTDEKCPREQSKKFNWLSGG